MTHPQEKLAARPSDLDPRQNPERARFEEWYTTHAFDYAANPIGSRDCDLQWRAWKAALLSEHGEVTVTTDESGRCVAVTRQDSEGRILSTIWEAPEHGGGGEAVYQVRRRHDPIYKNPPWSEVSKGNYESLASYAGYERRILYTTPPTPSAPEVVYAVPTDDETWEHHATPPPNCEYEKLYRAPSAPVVVLTGYQLRAALNFIAPDREEDQLLQEVAIQWGPAREHDEGRDEAGLFCWCVECPEEGSIRLDEKPIPGRDGLQYEPSTALSGVSAPVGVEAVLSTVDRLLSNAYGAGLNDAEFDMLAARKMVLAALTPPAAATNREWPGCSGDPASCPENEGYGCCKPNPAAAPRGEAVAYTECARDCDCVGYCKAGLEKPVATSAASKEGDLP